MTAGGGSIVIRQGIRPGDLGTIVHLHGALYHREYGLDATFEPYVARPLAEFVLAGPEAGAIWLAERGEVVLGVVAIVRTEPGRGQLRWFLVMPEARGTGLGRRLIATALAWGRNQRLHHLHLWTLDGLDAALHLYRAHGFVETERIAHDLWGGARTEIRMDLALAAADDAGSSDQPR